LGGRGPNGEVPGGNGLAARGVIVPAGAPKLPANLTARSWILADLDSGEVLAARDPHGRYQPASILKTLTAITVLPHLPAKRVVTISPQAAQAEGSAVGLLAGAKYSIDDLFHALMLVSGNDAAAALAEANGGIAQTVKQMNAKAEQLGAYDTFAQTPSGLDGWQQLTSAYDLELILRAALSVPRLVAYDRVESAKYPAKQSKYGKVGAYQFDNQMQNFLDGVPGALVAKSGYTDAARHTYLCATERHGRRLGIVFLRNERAPLDQWQQAAALFNWGYALAPALEPIGTLAGPMDAVSATSSPETPNSASASTAPSDSPFSVQTAANTLRRRTPVTAWILAAAVLGVGGVAGHRLTLRRTRRRR
jgi:D-alanyl-D-alanine carboxypeptidase (penicillin-binding protein 5/6)